MLNVGLVTQAYDDLGIYPEEFFVIVFTITRSVIGI